MSFCAIGLRAHSGWAALVALAGTRRAPEVVSRSRIEMADPAIRGSKQPYHEAEEMELRDAARYLARCERASLRLARAGLAGALEDLAERGHRPEACGILLAAGAPLPELASILASHARIHTADGEHFRNALAAAARERGLEVVRVRERDAAAAVASELRLAAEDLVRRVQDMRGTLGPPWTQDQKLATLAAWHAMSREARPAPSGRTEA